MSMPRAWKAVVLSLSLTLVGGAFVSGACSSAESDPSGNGGSPGSGGSPGTGGSPATGGSPGAGGSPATGGSPGAGGATATGGSPGTGGRPATGGAPAAGGSSGAAGSGRGGTGGASSTGGTAGGSVTPGSCIICDDFESSTSLDAAKWVIDTSNGSGGKAEIVSGGAHGSARAVMASGGYIKVDAKAGLFSSVPPHFFIRVNMKFDKPQPKNEHVTYLMLADKSKMGQLRVGAYNGGMIWNYDTNDTMLPDYNAAAMSLNPPANSWHCFEFEIDSSAPLLRAWMDGTESPQMLLDATATAGIDQRWMDAMPGWKPNITNFSFGAGYPAFVNTWYDDIAISATRIGCQF